MFDSLEQEIQVGDQIYYMNSAKGIGNFGTVTEVNEEKGLIKYQNEYGYKKTGKIPSRVIVLNEIYKNRPELAI